MQKHFRAERAKFLQFALENTANLPFFVYLFQDPPKMDPPPLNSHLRGGEKWTPPLNSLKRRRRENAVNSWGTPTSSAPPQKPAAAESSRKGGVSN